MSGSWFPVPIPGNRGTSSNPFPGTEGNQWEPHPRETKNKSASSVHHPATASRRLPSPRHRSGLGNDGQRLHDVCAGEARQRPRSRQIPGGARSTASAARHDTGSRGAGRVLRTRVEGAVLLSSTTKLPSPWVDSLVQGRHPEDRFSGGVRVVERDERAELERGVEGDVGRGGRSATSKSGLAEMRGSPWRRSSTCERHCRVR
jgi:hypothetical protein